MTTSLHASRCLSVALALTIGALGCRPSQPEAPAAVDVESIRQTVLGLEDAMHLAVDALDCAGGLAVFGDQQPIFVSEGHVLRTTTDLREGCEEMIAPRTGAEFSVEHITANVLSDEVAYVVREGDYTINLRDGTSKTIYLVITTLWHRDVDGWTVVHLHESVRVQS
jgi:ketosteroid isomerase-like protein